MFLKLDILWLLHQCWILTMLSVDSPLSWANRTDFTLASGTCPVLEVVCFVMSAYLTLLLYHTLLYIPFLPKKKKSKKEIQSQYFSIYKFVLWFAIIFLHQLIHVLLLMQCTWLITCISVFHADIICVEIFLSECQKYWLLSPLTCVLTIQFS